MYSSFVNRWLDLKGELSRGEGFVLCFFASTPNNVFLTLQLARQPYKSYNAKSKQLRTSKYKLQQDQWGEGAKKGTICTNVNNEESKTTEQSVGEDPL